MKSVLFDAYFIRQIYYDVQEKNAYRSFRRGKKRIFFSVYVNKYLIILFFTIKKTPSINYYYPSSIPLRFALAALGGHTRKRVYAHASKHQSSARPMLRRKVVAKIQNRHDETQELPDR